MRVLITGGAGYIGTALCQALLADPSIERVTIYDNLSRHNYNAFIGTLKLDHRFHFIEGDILDSRNLRKAVRNADAIFHLAAKVTTPFADQDAHLFEQVNHWGTAEVTYAVEESDVQRLVYLSSVSVYGSGEERKALGVQLNPKTFYGISKMRGEEHVRRLEDKVKTHIVRCGNVWVQQEYALRCRHQQVTLRGQFPRNHQCPWKRRAASTFYLHRYGQPTLAHDTKGSKCNGHHQLGRAQLQHQRHRRSAEGAVS